MATRVCIAMSPYTSGGEKFAGKATIYNGPAFSGYYNNHLGARYVQFGTPGGDAMVGLKMGYSDAYKVIKGKFGHPTNDCYRGELMPGYSVSCESAWTLDNSPSSPNQIMASIKVKATFWDGYSWWEGNGNEIDYSPLLG
ncbi:hypothetical protein PV371_38830 [Streptomyces sp. TX20-6-3]|uniref:hypothetical protein n=1 Tax=Streptomyces sp. TX20-6-3 TaxID=3028705 RepID=UPI0029B3C027|nr:hypothetical protein [Streptomyces sp. TX20-6-3]MDX2565463.1 hypothetical protein [Streptomyces sp. TX20-6-3]